MATEVPAAEASSPDATEPPTTDPGAADYRLILESFPDLFLVLAPTPGFTIVDASEAYLAATMTKREAIVGRGLFDVFPDNSAEVTATGTTNLRASLEHVLGSRGPDAMPVQKYDVRRPEELGGDFEERYWRPLNTPVLDGSGDVRYIVHRVEDVTAFVRVQQESQTQLALTGQVKEYAIFMLDPTGLVSTWSTGAQHLKGYSADEILGRHVSVFYTPEDIASGKPQQLLDRAAREGQSEDEGWRIRKDGSRFWADVLITAVRDPAGELTGFAKVTRDLTDKKRRVDQLRRWEHLFENAQWGIAIVDNDLQTLSLMNPAFAAMHGYEMRELQGQPLSQLIAVGYERASKRHIQSTVENRHHSFEILHRRKDGSQFPVLVDATAVQTGEGTLLYEAVQVQDITERKRKEDEQRFLADAGVVLASSFEEVETLSRIARLSVPLLADFCAIDLVGEDGQLRRVAAAHVDAEKRPLLEVAQAAPGNVDKPLLWSVLEQGQPVLQQPVDEEHLGLLVTDEGQRERLRRLAPRAYIAVPLSTRGRVVGAIFFFVCAPRSYGDWQWGLAWELGRRVALAVDNSRLYAAAQRAVEARDWVLSVVAHDLCNPLNVISLAARGIDRAVRRSQLESVQHSAESIVGATRTANRLIQDLLEVSRMESGQLTLELTPEDPATLLRDIGTTLRPLVESAGITFEEAVPSELPTVCADRERILQILSNLVGNACKFTPAGGRVTLKAEVQGEEIWFAVTDTGPGIPKDQLEHLFDRFWQGQPRDRLGVGLGLSISKVLVEAHRGRLWVESTVGRGTSFVFSVPVLHP